MELGVLVSAISYVHVRIRVHLAIQAIACGSRFPASSADRVQKLNQSTEITSKSAACNVEWPARSSQRVCEQEQEKKKKVSQSLDGNRVLLTKKSTVQTSLVYRDPRLTLYRHPDC